MRLALASLVLGTLGLGGLGALGGLAGCAGQSPTGSSDGTTDGTSGPDASGNPGADATPAAQCVFDDVADAGTLPALKAQHCNQSGTMGLKKWYRLSATVAGTPGRIVQLELWDGLGAFAGGAVRTGTFPITGAETDYATCGVCVRAIGDKGAADAKKYFATGGSVQVTAAGAAGTPLSAVITGVTLAEVDAMDKRVAGGCTASVAHVQIDGTSTDVGMGGGGGGGGGGGANQCPAGIGD